MIQREHYISKIRPFYESDLIKIITGIRRSGKSVVLEQIRDELAAQGKKILYLNLEDRHTSLKITNDQQLIEEIEKQLGTEKLYVFLDEVQNIKDWNVACRSLRLQNLSLFITGSNSRLLSGEFTKELSGRYVSFRVHPFVYRELQEYAAQLGRTVSVTDYLIWGGFPKRLEFPDEASVMQYLDDLDQTIVLNDIMTRYRIRKEAVFKALVNYVLISNARIFSAHSIYKQLKGQSLPCSPNTIMKYLGYLEEAYIINRLKQFSTRAKKELDFFAKIYNEDVALNTIRQSGHRWDLTHNLENVVYNELIYRGYELSVFTNKGQEIDFFAEKNGKQYLIQVAYSVAEEGTYNREFGAFRDLDQSRAKILITNDDVDYSTSTVRHIMLKDFLLAGDDAF